MEFTKLERQAIFAFGSESRRETVGRLGIVCSCITDSQLKRRLVDLHNKLGELSPDMDKWFAKQFRGIQDEMESEPIEYNKIAYHLMECIST